MCNSQIKGFKSRFFFCILDCLTGALLSSPVIYANEELL